MGRFDDLRYVEYVKKQFTELPKITPEAYQKAIAAISEKKVTLDQIKAKYSLSEDQEKKLKNL